MKKPYMLIVEDDAVCRSILQYHVQDLGGTCDSVGDGLQAIAAVQTAHAADIPYDVIFLDIQMPNMDGQEALKRIRELETEKGIMPGHGVKVIMVTAFDDAKNVMGAFRRQCEGYLVKPILKNKLHQLLAELGIVALAEPTVKG